MPALKRVPSGPFHIRVSRMPRNEQQLQLIESWAAHHRSKDMQRLMRALGQSIAASCVWEARQWILKRKGNIKDAPNDLNISGTYMGSFEFWEEKSARGFGNRSASAWRAGVRKNTPASMAGGRAGITTRYLAWLLEFGGTKKKIDRTGGFQNERVKAYPHWTPAKEIVSKGVLERLYKLMERWAQEGGKIDEETVSQILGLVDPAIVQAKIGMHSTGAAPGSQSFRSMQRSRGR